METYKITFTARDGTRTVEYCSFDNLKEVSVWAGTSAKNIMNLQSYKVERVVVDLEGYLQWLYPQHGAIPALQQIAKMLYFDDGEYDEDNPVDGGAMVELVADQMNIHSLTVEDYLKYRDASQDKSAEPEQVRQ